MGSFLTAEKCPRCGGIYLCETDNRSFEEYSFCSRCGKREEFIITKDEKGNAVLDSDGKVQYTHICEEGYGCIAIAGKKGLTIKYALNKPIELEQLENDYLDMLNNDEVDESKSYLSYWDEKKEEIIGLFGKLPDTYDDFMKK